MEAQIILKKRNNSWETLDLAMVIQFPKNVQAPRLMLWFLAKVGKNGISFHGYQSIAAHTGLSKDGIIRGLKYLRDELHILTWKSGGGGLNKKETNRYQLDLRAMRDLVRSQGVFDPETGKLLSYSRDCYAGKTLIRVASAGTPVISAGTSSSPQSSLLGESVESAGQGETLSNQLSIKTTPSERNTHLINSHSDDVYFSKPKIKNEKSNINYEKSVPAGHLESQPKLIRPNVNNRHDRMGLLELQKQAENAFWQARFAGENGQHQTELLKRIKEKLDQLICAYDGCSDPVSLKGEFCKNHHCAYSDCPNGVEQFGQICDGEHPEQQWSELLDEELSVQD
jgi:hypothetical protein